MAFTKNIAVCICLLATLSWAPQVSSKAIKKLNERPIIGIITQPDDHRIADEFIYGMYVQFFQGAGARVVAIRGKMPEDYYRDMFQKVNGVLFPGGEVPIDSGPYFETGKIIYELALEANDKGDYFPVWGTCLGHQFLARLTAEKDIRVETDSTNMTIPLDFLDGYQHSRLFGNMPSTLVGYLRDEPIAQHNHEFGLLTEDFRANEELNNFYQPLTTNKDRNGLEYVSTFEAYNYPFYGSQWHPEKNIYLWNTEMAIAHTPHAVRVSQYMANFFVDEARKNDHHFDSVDEEIENMVENDFRYFKKSHLFLTRYFYNYTTNANH